MARLHTGCSSERIATSRGRCFLCLGWSWRRRQGRQQRMVPGHGGR